MDNTRELVEALLAGHKVNLIPTPGTTVKNLHDLIRRLENEHGLALGQQSYIVNGRVGMVIWVKQAVAS